MQENSPHGLQPHLCQVRLKGNSDKQGVGILQHDFGTIHSSSFVSEKGSSSARACS